MSIFRADGEVFSSSLERAEALMGNKRRTSRTVKLGRLAIASKTLKVENTPEKVHIAVAKFHPGSRTVKPARVLAIRHETFSLVPEHITCDEVVLFMDGYKNVASGGAFVKRRITSLGSVEGLLADRTNDTLEFLYTKHKNPPIDSSVAGTLSRILLSALDGANVPHINDSTPITQKAKRIAPKTTLSQNIPIAG